MKSVVLVVLAVCVAACAALNVVPLPKITEEERKVFLANADLAVDCIIKPEKGCHPYSYDVHRKYSNLLPRSSCCPSGHHTPAGLCQFPGPACPTS